MPLAHVSLAGLRLQLFRTASGLRAGKSEYESAFCCARYVGIQPSVAWRLSFFTVSSIDIVVLSITHLRCQFTIPVN